MLFGVQEQCELKASFSTLPAQTRVLWAKSGEISGHGLLAHMLDVAAVAEAILVRESLQSRLWAARLFGLGEEVVTAWLSAWVGLHDFGKSIPGFQAKWDLGKGIDIQAGLPFLSASLSVDRHDLASAVLLRKLFFARFPGSEWILAVTQALGAHHGYMPSSNALNGAAPRNEGASWHDARETLLDAYWQTLQPDSAPSIPEISLPAAAWLAGLTSVADWIGSNQDWFPLGERNDALIGHYHKAQELAEIALDAIGWPKFHALLNGESTTSVLINRILGRSVVEARPLQIVADRLLEQASGPTLMIVEAPMGEGKTELAFLAHLRLQAANGHRGLYVALPTQATGNAMFERTLTFLKAFSPDVRLDIQLAHGGAMLDERILRLRGVDESADESITSSAWFSQRKRPLLSPYGVGTIDQALFATLNVKHHFVRLWGLANRVVVLDEVHAYDTYTSGLIEALLRWLKAMNCSVVLMSATLPAKRRSALLQAWGLEGESDVAYPRILMSCGDQLMGEHVTGRSLAPIGIAAVSEDIQALADRALEALSGGGCGAVVVNTVQRAQQLYLLLSERVESDTELLLFHARFPADERSQRERKVLACFGRGEKVRRPVSALLVATQVVEQSLDIDFDFMVTDLAPVDLLLQRAGRLHRHERQRPEAHRQPRLTVAGFQREREPELKQTAWGFVYDPYVLYRTWSIAGSESVWRLPEDIDRLVQAVYANDPLADEDRAEFVKKLDSAFGEHLATVQERRQRAINVAIDAEAEPQNAYTSKPRANEEGEGDGLRVVTRLGDDSLSVVPILVDEDGWRLLPGDDPFDAHAEIDNALAHRIYRRQLRLSRKNIVLDLLGKSVPASFASHPLLGNLKPLLLQDGVALFGKLQVRLDPELGITYETVEDA